MPGDIDPTYARARAVLLDALVALREQLDAIILVGAQAIYLHTGDTDLAVSPYTTDADLALNPLLLQPVPKLGETLEAAGFEVEPNQPGIWMKAQEGATVDLLVPETVGGAGRRGARLGPHGNTAARKARGLEAALVDNSPMLVGALDPSDLRRFTVNVAGPAALLVAKLHKVAERSEQPRRQDAKDALDIYRLLQAISTADLARGLARLAGDPQSQGATERALTYLDQLFRRRDGIGAELAAQALVPLEDPDIVRASCNALADAILDAVGQ